MPEVAKKDRSPAYPAMSLPESIKKLAQYYTICRRHPVDANSAYDALGYKSANGAAKRCLAALISFGLIEPLAGESERRVKLSDLGFSILMLQPATNPDKLAAIKTAAMRPKIYADLVARYGGDLPGDTPLTNYLVVDKGFNPTSVPGLIADFRATYVFANLQSSGTLFDEDLGDEDLDDAEEEVESPRPPPVHPRTPQSPERDRLMAGTNSASTTRVLSIPLSGGKTAILETPSDMDSNDFAFLSTFVKLMKDAIITTRPTSPDVAQDEGDE